MLKPLLLVSLPRMSIVLIRDLLFGNSSTFKLLIISGQEHIVKGMSAASKINMTSKLCSNLTYQEYYPAILIYPIKLFG